MTDPDPYCLLIGQNFDLENVTFLSGESSYLTRRGRDIEHLPYHSLPNGKPEFSAAALRSPLPIFQPNTRVKSCLCTNSSFLRRLLDIQPPVRAQVPKAEDPGEEEDWSCSAQTSRSEQAAWRQCHSPLRSQGDELHVRVREQVAEASRIQTNR